MAILNLSIELNDFWSEGGEEDSLNDLLKASIIREVTGRIREQVSESVNKLIKEEFGEKLQTQINQMIAGKLEALILTETINIRGQEVKITDHVKSMFMDNNRRQWEDLNDIIKGLARKWGDDLKSRYDITFANQLVQRLNENGLLLPDVGKRLLDTPTK